MFNSILYILSALVYFIVSGVEIFPIQLWSVFSMGQCSFFFLVHVNYGRLDVVNYFHCRFTIQKKSEDCR
jgi:hypothetical protein